MWKGAAFACDAAAPYYVPRAILFLMSAYQLTAVVSLCLWNRRIGTAVQDENNRS